LEAIVFTSQGDMRQGLNNLQSTYNGFGSVDEKNVFKVCDEPHPMLVKEMLQNCVNGNIDDAFKVILKPHLKSAVFFINLRLQGIAHLWKLGYAAEDLIQNMFRVCKTIDTMSEFLMLEFLKVSIEISNVL